MDVYHKTVELVCYGRKKLWGTDYRYFVTMSNHVKENDIICIYVTSKSGISLRKMVQNGYSEEECSKLGFVAVGRIVSQMFVDENHIGWRNVKFKPAIYPYRVKIELDYIAKNGIKIIPTTTNRGEYVNEVNQNGFVNRLKFIADKSKSWGPYVFPSMVLLTQGDFETVKNAVRDAAV